jgi:hypothetical protein
MEVAAAIARRAPEGNLSSQGIVELMSATSEAQGRVALLRRLLHYARDGLQLVSNDTAFKRAKAASKPTAEASQ